MVSKSRAAAYKQTHARILLLCDENQAGNQAGGGMQDKEIARSLKVGTATVERVHRRCVEEGLERALGRKEQHNRRQRKLVGGNEAHLIALACGEPSEGRVSWTMQLLADGLVEREIVESISAETVRRTLKNPNSSPRSATGQALAEGVLVHPAPEKRRPRVRHGGCAGGLSSTIPGQ